MPIRVMHFGLGPIGVAVVRQVAVRKGFVVAGGIDVDPEKVGRDVGKVAGLEAKLGILVSADAAKALRAARPDVVVLCTRSSLKDVAPQIEGILRARVPVVSTTEELACPTGGNRRRARRLDALAKRAKVAVLGTGVNPGFVMDALPIMLTAVCERVERIEVERVQDARIRRLPFQKKIGAGLSVDEFQQRAAAGLVRHVGMAESIAMIAAAVGWTLDRVTDEVKPKIAEAAVESEHLRVERGQVSGLVQDAVGYRGDVPLVHLHMEAYLGAPETYDAVRIAGSPPLDVKLRGGVHGDVATASIVVNAIPRVIAAPPGLHTMRDMLLPSYAGRAHRTKQ